MLESLIKRKFSETEKFEPSVIKLLLQLHEEWNKALRAVEKDAPFIWLSDLQSKPPLIKCLIILPCWAVNCSQRRLLEESYKLEQRDVTNLRHLSEDHVTSLPPCDLCACAMRVFMTSHDARRPSANDSQWAWSKHWGSIVASSAHLKMKFQRSIVVLSDHKNLSVDKEISLEARRKGASGADWKTNIHACNVVVKLWWIQSLVKSCCRRRAFSFWGVAFVSKLTNFLKEKARGVNSETTKFWFRKANGTVVENLAKWNISCSRQHSNKESHVPTPCQLN